MAEGKAAYADVIIDISHEQIDRPFQYRIPETLREKVSVGCQVTVPFGKGNRLRGGFVIACSDVCTFDRGQIKDIYDVPEHTVPAEAQMIRLAAWIRREYGCTMIQALKTVLPVKEKVKPVQQKTLVCGRDAAAVDAYLELAKQKHWSARFRILSALKESGQISWLIASKELGASAAVVKPMEDAGVLQIISEIEYRSPFAASIVFQEDGTGQDAGSGVWKQTSGPALNPEQQAIVSGIIRSFQTGDRTPCLIHGITGSGKTEVYMHLIEAILKEGRSAIVLIPEISLTYQTVMRFYARFGSLVSIVNSRLSQGERFDQFERAKKGEIRIMIGPRSALFTPFENLGLIVIDEEQESAYISEQAPRYHARETAIERARLADAVVVMGSATPSVDAYAQAKAGNYRLYTLTKRAVAKSSLAQTEIVDLRKEMEEGNRSVFSRLLQERMDECLRNRQQMMLFLNRRGYSKAVSCRSCGQPVGCPHCAVPLTEHTGQRLICHYCGYTIRIPSKCPSCGSPYLAGFGMGTQKIELLAKERFPQARILRMDYDTTSKKGGHEEILKAFAEKKADILVGTQMIVKGHDFPGVTLVGILAADMSLYNGDFRSGEKTFQLLTQAAGRAGRGDMPGTVVIQTYDPENPSIRAAAAQDYPGFFEEEMRFRRLMAYPPAGHMCEVLAASQELAAARRWIQEIAILINRQYHGTITVIGPSDAPVARIRDFWRVHLFFKTADHAVFLDALGQISGLEAQMRQDGVYLSSALL